MVMVVSGYGSHGGNSSQGGYGNQGGYSGDDGHKPIKGEGKMNRKCREL